RGLGEGRVENQQGAVAQHQAGGYAPLRPAGQPAPPPAPAPLHGHQHRAAPLATDRDALQQTEQSQQPGAQQADLRVGGQYPDQARGEPHREEGDDQGGLTADAITEVAKDESAQDRKSTRLNSSHRTTSYA